MAVKATWTRDNREDRDDPQGVLYLTDQRMIFEQKQEVATKKVLFITTERKLVQEMQLEFAVDRVTDVRGSKQGMFKNEDFLELTLATGAPVKSTQFHIFGQDCMAWVGLINRARTHEFDQGPGHAARPGRSPKGKKCAHHLPKLRRRIPPGHLARPGYDHLRILRLHHPALSDAFTGLVQPFKECL